MAKRKSPYPEKPWHPDPAKWQRHLEKKPIVEYSNSSTPQEPKGGWMLYRLDTLEDVKQTT